MTKSGIVGEVAVRTCVSRKEVAGAVDAVFEPIAEELARREQVRTAAVGLFTTRARPALAARNPLTGQPVAVESSTASTFKPAMAIREAVNGGVSS